MRNFPIPYEGELIYGVIARAGLRAGITSPKRLSTELFDRVGVVATYDLPIGIKKIQSYLDRTRKHTVESLIYGHTIFPLYAPFVQESNRKLAMESMASNVNRSIHLRLGVSASVVKTVHNLRYCAVCAEEQLKENGEQYWRREWFLPALPYCQLHQGLTQLVQNKVEARHTFTPLRPLALGVTEKIGDNQKLRRLAEFSSQLLSVEQFASPTLNMWTQFYRSIADECGLTTGANIKHHDVYDAITEQYGIENLHNLNLLPGKNQDTNWFRSIFRKHKKAFSFLQHTIVWQALLPNSNVSEILSRVKTLEKSNAKPAFTSSQSDNKIDQNADPDQNEKRIRWLELLAINGVKAARKEKPGGALYAWLYRNDKDWLLSTNKGNGVIKRIATTFVDWPKRDLITVKQLLKIKNRYKYDFESGRRSANWYLNQLGTSKSTIEKNLQKLSLTTLFLYRYAESVSGYQVRRICMVYVKREMDNMTLRRADVLQESGINLCFVKYPTELLIKQLRLQ